MLIFDINIWKSINRKNGQSNKEKNLLLTLSALQRIPHNTNILNCQFYPICRATAIKNIGVWKHQKMIKYLLKDFLI